MYSLRLRDQVSLTLSPYLTCTWQDLNFHQDTIVLIALLMLASLVVCTSYNLFFYINLPLFLFSFLNYSFIHSFIRSCWSLYKSSTDRFLSFNSFCNCAYSSWLGGRDSPPGLISARTGYPSSSLHVRKPSSVIS